VRSEPTNSRGQNSRTKPPATVRRDRQPSWDGIGDVTRALQLAVGSTLLDLACGRGGYGLEVARRTGARLIGVDFSAEALRQAGQQAARLGRDAEFRLGDLTATGLEAGSVSAVLCVDAVQFADPIEAAFAEMRRVLAPGGRAVLTGWEALDPDDGRVPARIRQISFSTGLAGTGFTAVEVVDRPAWRERERTMWEEAAGLDPGTDPSLQSFHDEGVRGAAGFPASPPRARYRDRAIAARPLATQLPRSRGGCMKMRSCLAPAMPAHAASTNLKWSTVLRQSSCCSSSMVMPTSEQMPRSVPFATSRPLCTGTVVPRPSGWRMTWWLPVTRATLNPARSKARTIRSPCTDGTAGIRRHQP